MRKNKNNKGFTLVELIVVLVILAILAAILIPELLGYIDRAREKQYILDAKNLLTASQAELTEYYATGADTLVEGQSIIPGSSKAYEKNGDVDASGTDFAKKVLKTADMEGANQPYVFMIAVGSNYDKYKSAGGNGTTIHDKYTVYYALYMKSAEDPPYYYYNGKWTKKNPRGKGGTNPVDLFEENNTVKDGPQKGMRLQYYLISNKTGKKYPEKAFWDYLKETIDKKWN